ncbi:MAG: PD40 domain-containing protein, partial [Actinobacteria bacterium]|nr:PD40 domain-containing protein [Actinomycetota bacterium]
GALTSRLLDREGILLIRLLVLAAGAAVAIAGCGGGDEQARPDLVFVSTRDDDYSIYEMNADGGGQKRLTDAEMDASTPGGLFFQVEPAWSPDGTKIVFSSRRSGSFDIFVMNADGTGTTSLTSTKEDDSHPTWSPDGDRVTFARDGPGDIYVMSSDGSGAHRISDPRIQESEPAWSPDGDWIAYIRRTPGTPVREVWLTRPDGTERHALTSGGAKAYTPAWSPDSARIVFTSDQDGKVFELYTVGVDGRGLRSVTPTAGDLFEPSWSPDGSKIAFSEGGSIFTVELGGGNAVQLTDNENNDSSPAWKPRPPAEEE